MLEKNQMKMRITSMIQVELVTDGTSNIELYTFTNSYVKMRMIIFLQIHFKEYKLLKIRFNGHFDESIV